MADDRIRDEETRSPASRGTETILFADDDADVRTFVSMALERLGYRVLTAVDGKDALRVLAEQGGAVDCLLTDIVMPEMNGWDLGKAVASDYPATKIVYVSAHLDSALVRNATRLNAIDLLQKPLTPRKLAEKIRSVLDSKP